MSGATNEAVACTVSFSFLKMPNSRVKGAEIIPGGPNRGMSMKWKVLLLYLVYPNKHLLARYIFIHDLKFSRKSSIISHIFK